MAEVTPAGSMPADVTPADNETKDNKFAVEKVAVSRLRSLLSEEQIASLKTTKNMKEAVKANKDNIHALMARNLYLEEFMKKDGVAKDETDYIVAFITVTYKDEVKQLDDISSKCSLSLLKEKACGLFEIRHKDITKKKFFIKLGDETSFRALADVDGKSTISAGLQKKGINIQTGDLLKIECWCLKSACSAIKV